VQVFPFLAILGGIAATRLFDSVRTRLGISASR